MRHKKINTLKYTTLQSNQGHTMTFFVEKAITHQPTFGKIRLCFKKFSTALVAKMLHLFESDPL